MISRQFSLGWGIDVSEFWLRIGYHFLSADQLLEEFSYFSRELTPERINMEDVPSFWKIACL